MEQVQTVQKVYSSPSPSKMVDRHMIEDMTGSEEISESSTLTLILTIAAQYLPKGALRKTSLVRVLSSFECRC